MKNELKALVEMQMEAENKRMRELHAELYAFKKRIERFGVKVDRVKVQTEQTMRIALPVRKK